MKWLGSSTILRSATGSVRHQELRNRSPKCRGRHVERGVARVEVVSDVGEEKRRGLLTCRADVGPHRGKRRSGSHTPGHFVEVPVHDDANEFKKD
jgi:hypothetical protein